MFNISGLCIFTSKLILKLEIGIFNVMNLTDEKKGMYTIGLKDKSIFSGFNDDRFCSNKKLNPILRQQSKKIKAENTEHFLNHP